MLPSIRLEFEFENTNDGVDKAVALLRFADTLTPAQSAPEAAPPPSHPPPTATKGKPAPAPAPAKGKAAKANSKAPSKEPDLMDLNSGDEAEDEEEDGGLGLADDADDGLGEFSGTAEEAKEEALAKLRTMLGNGLKTEVKKVQTIMKVAKFHDVPAEQGFEFLKAVQAVEAKIAKN